MTQGNPFGQKGGRWMSAAKLRALFKAGKSYDDIAEANYRSEGWKPSRSAVLRKYQAMGMPPRNASHSDLIPWNVRPEHNDSRLRHMLQAESRRRQKRALSETDKKLVQMLDSMLFNRGKLMVVAYSPDIGFVLADREDTDDDIIRQPESAGAFRKELRPGLREAEAAQTARGLEAIVEAGHSPEEAARIMAAIRAATVPTGEFDADQIWRDARGKGAQSS